MLNFDYITKEDIKKRNPNLLENPDYPYRIIGGSEPGKINASLNQINNESDLIKFIYMQKRKYRLKLFK